MQRWNQLIDQLDRVIEEIRKLMLEVERRKPTTEGYGAKENLKKKHGIKNKEEEHMDNST